MCPKPQHNFGCHKGNGNKDRQYQCYLFFTHLPPPLLPLSLRYLLPGLCHLSAEEGPRKVLLTLDTPALLVDFLSQSWTSLKGKSGVASARDPSMETVCSALLNFTVTEPERVR